MKNKLVMTLASAVFVIGLSVAASAQTNRHWHNYGINARERHQQQRIYQGIHSGQLNRREAYRLETQQQRIDRIENRYRNSGHHLSYRERYRLERDLNRSSRRIYRQKHDNQSLYGYPR
jgi:Spy/CpxP family protein refolding chaperone